MLACARIGAVHSVIFAGFSAEAIADRNNDAQAKLQLTADYGWRRGQELPLKKNVDEALEEVADGEELHRAQANRQSGAHAGRPRSLVARPDGRGFGRLPGRAARQRASAVHPVHQRLDRQAQGHSAHHGRLQPVRRRRRSSGSSTIATRTSSGARPTSAGSPGTAT